ncbi:hypothetical protein A0H81_14362 [Grifola frondosa]|uniref:Uncharacterized protein n=1 Tax=Grifola frondosa TaxID=5627 RepID=A0A1C7LLN9_GRIFR|nr:hypothetical protein A0H81_14362 [Grifola frondosa]
MVYATLSVVQYRSPAGGCGHWAFNLVITNDDNKENYILQIENSSGEFKFEELENVDPESSTRYIRSVPISDSIDGQAAIDHVREILREQPIRRYSRGGLQKLLSISFAPERRERRRL